MRTYRMFIAAFSVLTLLISVGYAGTAPRSNQVLLIENVSPAEVLVQATGIGVWQKGDSKFKNHKNHMLLQAEDDARKAAAWFIVLGDSDPLLSTAAEKNAFSAVEGEFYEINNIKSYINWEATDFDKGPLTKTIEKKKKYELTIAKRFKISREKIRNFLITKNVLTSKAELAETIGLPSLMVLPAAAKGQNPLDLLNDPNLSHAAKSLESALTAQMYEVIVPEASLNLAELSMAQMSIKDVEEDYSYQIALSIGSDIYITYEVSLEAAKFGTKKAIVSVRAYETTTARLLGTETGYSPAAKAPDQALIENAIQDAITKVLQRVTNYWKSDIKRGIQYKVIVSIPTDFDGSEITDIQDAFFEAVEEVAKNDQIKENIVTDQTIDIQLWVDPDKYKRSSKLDRKMRRTFEDAFEDGVLKKINVNRKLLMYTIEAN